MTKRKLRFGALPKLQMGTKSQQSSKPTPRPERSVVTTFYRIFQEFCQRAKSLKTPSDWISKFPVDRAVLKKMVDPYLLPELEVIVDDGQGFTVKVYGSYLVVSMVPTINEECDFVKFIQRTGELPAM